MNPSAFDGIVRHELALQLQFRFFVPLTVVDGHQFRRQIRHGEEVVVLHICRQELNTLFREFDLVLLLVNDEVQFRISFGHFTLVVREVDGLRLEQLLLHPFQTEEFDERLRLGQCAVGAEQGQAPFRNFVFGRSFFLQEPLRVGHELLSSFLLDRNELNHLGLELDEFLLVAFRGGAADDQRGSSLVDQDRIHLVDDGKVVLALHQLLRSLGHVVPEVVKAKFVVGAVSDVRTVGFSARLAVGLVLVNAIHAHAVELKQRRHPLGVTAGEVIIHCYEVNAFSGQRIEEDGQCRHQRLSFPGLHFRHLASVQRRTTDQLHIVMDHVPFDFGSCGHPSVAPNRLVAIDVHTAAFGSNVPVPIVRRDGQLTVLSQASGGFLHQCKGFCHDAFQNLFQRFINALHQSVNLLVKGLLALQLILSHPCSLLPQRTLLFFQSSHMRLDAAAQIFAALSQAIIAQRLQLRFKTMDCVDHWLNLLHIPLGFVADQFFQKRF